MKHPNMARAFPRHIHEETKDSQREALNFLTEHGCGLIEKPTGSGKTATGITFLRAYEKAGVPVLFYLVPNKTLAAQVQEQYPEVRVVYGRNEHPCLYYEDSYQADEVPCSMLGDCPHRVDQDTGQTHEPGALPCPYLQQKYEAKQGTIVVATYAFYLFAHFFQKEWGKKQEAMVIDEAHRLAESIRSVLSYEITDYQLGRALEALSGFADDQTILRLEEFQTSFLKIIKSKPSGQRMILTEDDIYELLYHVQLLQPTRLRQQIAEAVRKGRLDPIADRETLRRLEDITYSLTRYLRSLEYSVKDGKRKALNYIFAYWQSEKGEHDKVQYRLVVKAYAVGPLIAKMLPKRLLAMSATISDPDMLKIESGIDLPFLSLTSDWPSENTRIFMPTDSPNLAVNKRGRDGVVRTQNTREKTKILRKVAKACKRFGDQGLRSLVVVVSNDERHKFLALAEEEGVDVISYDAERKPREVAQAFKDGEGDVLVGTTAHFGEGIDLPDGTAPITFFLRPGYPNPTEPGTQFEADRFGSRRWALWQWRVIVQALQVRGRNVRSVEDKGVTIFVSQQFRKFLLHSLPEWLKPAYRGNSTWEQCLDETEALLLKRKRLKK
ncbi:MAG: helicase C-terminal domain-containing protein [Patescibacteria group bacterium]